MSQTITEERWEDKLSYNLFPPKGSPLTGVRKCTIAKEVVLASLYGRGEGLKGVEAINPQWQLILISRFSLSGLNPKS